MANKIDSNVTGLAYAVEDIGSPKSLSTPVWKGLEPNSYSDFGGNVSTVARDTINPSRQRQKGTPTDFDASGGFNIDITKNNLVELMQGFMFANYHEKADTKPLNGSAITITSVTTTTYTAASGLSIFRAGDIIMGTGFSNPGNNGTPRVLSATATGSVTTTGLTAEASPPAGSSIQAVGYQFASGDATMTVTSGVATLGATTKDLTQLGLVPGEWVFIGGDSSATKFATSPVGYARVKTVSATAIVFDKVTSAFVTDNGSGKTVQIFFGKFLRNESGANIITRTYNLERQLGNDGSGIQSEYLEGSIPNTFALNLPAGSKLSADLGFIAPQYTSRSGATGVKSGTRVAALGEDAFNTSSKVYRTKINVIDPTTLQPSSLFAYIEEGSININNNASLLKAVGVLGGVDTVIGNFEVSGSVTAIFTTVAAVAAVRNSADVTMDFIFTQENFGLVYDLPLVSLGNGRINVQKDQAIKIPLETLAAQGEQGYTLGFNVFPYLPNAAMS